ncbi:hypothetical protein Nepgr_024965 [Nepenthes gracilis]|uniref:Uncharacterized protein n=1 Tax=Nepenthes gracilis TaxID=150966 RepID=A0AAD3T5J1_NEPGR|nr:hypothetical protein Nepgr_024965 [Nepenthes gracilis]
MVIGFVGPLSAMTAILTGIDYNGLNHLTVIACGGLLPIFGSLGKRSLRLDRVRCSFGIGLGFGFASSCLTLTKLVCLHTPYCNSAPEAVR